MRTRRNHKRPISLKNILTETYAILFSPQKYFKNLQLSGKPVELLFKIIVYSFTIATFSSVAFFFKLEPTSVLSLIKEHTGVSAFFVSEALVLLKLFVGALVLSFFSSLFGGNKKYQAALRVATSLLAVGVVKSMVFFLNGVSFYLTFTVQVLLNLWALYLLYTAMVYSLKAKEKSVRHFVLLLTLLMLVWKALSLVTMISLNSYMD